MMEKVMMNKPGMFKPGQIVAPPSFDAEPTASGQEGEFLATLAQAGQQAPASPEASAEKVASGKPRAGEPTDAAQAQAGQQAQAAAIAQAMAQAPATALQLPQAEQKLTAGQAKAGAPAGVASQAQGQPGQKEQTLKSGQSLQQQQAAQGAAPSLTTGSALAGLNPQRSEPGRESAAPIARDALAQAALSKGAQELAPRTAVSRGEVEARPTRPGARPDLANQAAPAQTALLEAALLDAMESDPALEAQVAQLVGAANPGIEVGPTPGKKALPKPAQASLSGSEFLNTLSAAKGGLAAGTVLAAGKRGGAESEPDAQSGLLAGKRELGQVKGKGRGAEFGGVTADALTAQSLQSPLASRSPSEHSMGTALPKAELTGHVVQGANAESRLSSESLTGIATGLRSLSVQNGGGLNGGEMRIRLKPENLGELHVRVITQGNHVGLQIQASDEKSKKILEESLSHLKESLAAQNLSLGAVDVSIAQPQSSQGSNLSQNGQGDRQSQFDWLGGQSQNHQGQGQGTQQQQGQQDGHGLSSRIARGPSVSQARAFGGASAGASGPAVSEGRLDVRA